MLTPSRNCIRAIPALALLALCLLPPAQAAEVTPTGFLVRHEVTVSAPPAKVYEAFVSQVGSWWNAQHTYSGDAANLSIDARAGGCFCEKLRDGGVEHMRVVQIRQNRLVRMAGGLGPLQASGLAGAMTWQFSALDGGTKLELVYSVGGLMSGGFDAIAPAVERMLGEQVERLKRFVETGAPAPK
jgi:uncharacterized protein YndB with AHSA1/START domain